MQYPAHKRDAFAQWVEDGFPTVAVVEVNYEEHEVPADEMLDEMLHCSDVLPSGLVDDISAELWLEPSEWRHTYGEASRRLLKVRETA